MRGIVKFFDLRTFVLLLSCSSFFEKGTLSSLNVCAEGVIRDPYNSNENSKYIELLFMVDQRERSIHSYCLELANTINYFYRDFNTFVALVDVVAMPSFRVSTKASQALDGFSDYVRSRDLPHFDVAVLLTQTKFEGNVAGKAYVGGICTVDKSVAVVSCHSSSITEVAMTAAHEMGHILGLGHDQNWCRCDCIMDASQTKSSVPLWSACSKENVSIIFKAGHATCLEDKPLELFYSPHCGNGFVEVGEQCDCGLPSHCDSPCCNPRTCRLHANATCATGPCCHPQTCQFKKAGHMCRVSHGECDLPEHCSGTDEYCPTDDYLMNGSPCKRGEAYCYNGQCNTHLDQCIQLWGSDAQNADGFCYSYFNVVGDVGGNCGFKGRFEKCQAQDVLCGLLHCEDKDGSIAVQGPYSTRTAHTKYHKNGYSRCQTAVKTKNRGLSPETSPEVMVPDGAKCGNNTICLDQRCVSISSVAKLCVDCGSGVCNNRGQCYGRTGVPLYFPPPSTVERGLHIAILVLFFGICPAGAIFCYFYWKSSLALNCGTCRTLCTRLPCFDHSSTGSRKRSDITSAANVDCPPKSKSPAGATLTTNSGNEVVKPPESRLVISKPVLESSSYLPNVEVLATRLEQLGVADDPIYSNIV